MADLSVVYPVARGTGSMLSIIGVFLILGETPTGTGLVGLVPVVAGIAVIAMQGKISAFKRPGGQTGIKWGTASGGLIASYTVIDAYAVKALGIASVVLGWCANLLRFFLLLPLVLSLGLRTKDVAGITSFVQSTATRGRPRA